MPYKILESHCTFKNNQLTEVAVLWDDNGAVRATLITSKPTAGYSFILPSDTLSPQLLQTAAASGSYLTDEQKRKFFPGKRPWSR